MRVRAIENLGFDGQEFLEFLPCSEVFEENLRNMGLEPADFTFYTDGFRYGAPPHAGWGLGVARLLMVLTGAGNVREVVLFPRDRSRVTP